MGNPFLLGSDDSLRVEPCVVVIFGATGDLTHRKLVPGLYNLEVGGLLPANFNLVGFARREYSDDEFRSELKTSVSKFSRRVPLNEEIWAEFARDTSYISSAFDDIKGYEKLRQYLEKLDEEAGTQVNRVFYFATAPSYFEIIAQKLKEAGLLSNERTPTSGGAPRTRVIVEKPFGHDLDSARELNKSLLNCMAEDQIYRIDHYLGKETVQNILVFRFANGIFEPIWNHKYIDHVEISVCESIGVGSRASYFEKSGILRDIVQNHALQLLCLVALEPPVAFEADAVRDEKVKVLRSIRRLAPEVVSKHVVRARYLEGSVGGEIVPGYLDEKDVDPRSSTETYVAMELSIDNWRWAGVPFYLRSGKRLAKRVTEISIHFRNVPHPLFRQAGIQNLNPNILSFQIQPDEGIGLKISSKPPGPQLRVQTVNMNFAYGSSFGEDAPEAYERLLLDCMRGDATLFTRNDEIEQAWDVVGPILNSWVDPKLAIPLYGYESGTWGPDEAEKLVEQENRPGWRRL